MDQSKITSRGRRILGYAIAILFLGLVGAIMFALFSFQQMTRNWYQPLSNDLGLHAQLEGQSGPTVRAPVLELLKKPAPLKPFTLLLVGIDSRDGERARSDTMILAAVHPEKQRSYLLSIPRDTFMQLPGRGYDKVNHAMAFGGPQLVKQSLESFFHMKIDKYMTIDFDGFRKIVDELGGVEVNVKKRMKYTDPTDDTYIDLRPGVQTLNGKQALDYARYRKSDKGPDDSDYDRILRQQEIMKALANKGDSVQAFVKAFKLMDVLGQHVKTDLTDQEIASLLVTYYDPKNNQIVTETLKGADERIWRHGIRGWYYLVPQEERKRIRSKFFQELAP